MCKHRYIRCKVISQLLLLFIGTADTDDIRSARGFASLVCVYDDGALFIVACVNS